jgi:hypothetical protein
VDFCSALPLWSSNCVRSPRRAATTKYRQRKFSLSGSRPRADCELTVAGLRHGSVLLYLRPFLVTYLWLQARSSGSAAVRRTCSTCRRQMVRASSPGGEHRHITARAVSKKLLSKIVFWSSDLWHCVASYPEDGGNMFCRNPGDHEPECTEL